MDKSKKSLVIVGIMVVGMILALLAVTGSSWLISNDDEAEVKYGLSEGEVEVLGITLNYDFSEQCKNSNAAGDWCGLRDAGRIGTIGLYLGLTFSTLLVAMLLLPMGDINLMDERVPEMGRIFLQWAPGIMFLIGPIGWLIRSPEFGDSIGLGFSFWLAIFSGSLALAAAGVEQFLDEDEEVYQSD
ncbi:hypothetical protein N8930_01270 [Euryarchaeota archaeon]|jgi:hypothetical protein|nr:hypothetical protein [Euryarchaeota archaeon]